jgi:hypothetical protein
MAPNVYAVGQSVNLTFTFKNTAGAVTDPASGTIYVKHPNGTEDTTPLSSATHVSTGVYQITATPDAAGSWYYRAVGVTPTCASLDQYFVVNPTGL